MSRQYYVANVVMSGLLLATLVTSQRTQWCEHHDHDHGHVHPEDFLVEIFNLYGDNSTCTVPEHDFEHLLEDLGIGDDTHAPHASHRRRKREVDHTCYSGEELLTIYNISHEVGVTESEFIELSPALVQQVVQGCHAHDHSHTDEPTAAEIWGYGTLSVVVISAFAPLGLVVVRWSETTAYKYIMTTMLGLAVGALAGDALMHLIPHGLGIHSHEDGHSHGAGVEDFVWKTFLACIAIWTFFNMEAIMAVLSDKSGHGHSHSMEYTTKVAPTPTARDNSQIGHEPVAKDKSSAKRVEIPEDDQSEKGLSDDVKAEPSIALMVTVGDGFHNFADGMAIGAAYTIDWQTGLSTSIAVLIHEIAHEFGDVAALLSTGWPWKRIFVIQLLTQSMALLGLCAGIPVAQSSEDAQQWILCLAAGMFLYVALCDIVPELMNYVRCYSPWHILGYTNTGMLFGFLFMFGIAALEGTISF